MALSFSPAVDIIPELLISGLLAFLFYANFRKLNSKVTPAPTFILVRGDTLVEAGSGMKSSPVIDSLLKDMIDILRNSQMLFITVTLWIVLTMLMIPSSRLSFILPDFHAPITGIVYGSLAVIIAGTVITTVVTRIKKTRMNFIILLVIGGAGAFISFYLPLMSWASFYGQIMKITFVYSVVAATVFGIYYIYSIMKEKNAVRMATIGAYLSYFFTATLLALNLFSNIL